MKGSIFIAAGTAPYMMILVALVIGIPSNVEPAGDTSRYEICGE